jgi:hypothetical protein
MTPSGIEPATSLFVAQGLNQPRYRVPHDQIQYLQTWKFILKDKLWKEIKYVEFKKNFQCHLLGSSMNYVIVYALRR